jgi:aryl-alcohol dehydrogenase-like predicted oxidoreductase
VDRARTRHFSSARGQARHGEDGLEAETFEAIQGIRAVAEDLGVPMADVAIAWLIGRPGVASVIVGGRRVDQVVRNRKAAELVLPDGALQRLNAATAPLKTKLGTNLDMWQGGTRTRVH